MARERVQIALWKGATYNWPHEDHSQGIAGRSRMNFSALILLVALATQNAIPAPKNHIGPEARSQFFQASLRATALRTLGNYDEAAAALEKALIISRDNDLDHQYRQCLMRIGILKWDLGSVPDSMSLFMEAMAAFRHAGDNRAAEFCEKCIMLIRLYEEGKQNREAKLYHRSLACLEQACSIGIELGIPDFELKCLRQKGFSHWEMGQIELFLECNKRGLRISDRINHQIEKGRSLNNLGISYHKLNEYSLALEYLESALSTIREAGDRLTEAECLSNLGLLYRDLGNYKRAHFCLTGALVIDREIGVPRSIASDLANIGTVFLRSGIDSGNKQELIQGLDAFLECSSLRGTDRAIDPIGFTALNNIGVIYNELGNPANSRHFLNLALQAVGQGRRILERGCILNNLAASYLYENNLSEASRLYLMSYDLGVQHSLENLVIESCYGLGKCCELGQRFSEALNYYQRSISSLERVREKLTSETVMIGFSRNKLDPYHSAIGLLASLYQEEPTIERLEQIFNFMERAKARAFLNSIQDSGRDLTDQEALLNKERLAKLEERISSLTANLGNPGITDLEKSLLNAELEHDEEDYHRIVSDLKPGVRKFPEMVQERLCSIQQIQRFNIDDCSALMEYFLSEERSYLVLTTPKVAELFILAGKDEIESSLRGFLKIVSEASIDRQAGYVAAERIAGELAPFNWREKLGDLRSLVIIPDGILHRLPFETLRIRGDGDSKFLLEAYSVSYCPSASSFSALSRAPIDRKWNKEILAIGGPVYDGEIAFVREPELVPGTSGMSLDRGHPLHLAPLPSSRREIAEVSRLFPKDKVRILVGQEANEDVVRAIPLEDFRIIHFACHGLLDDQHPLRSALVLSQAHGQKSDGLLQVREIYGLKTNADLIVLSACQTARGFLESAEGPMGLARAFFFSGARAVLAALWPISDKAALYLMREFYRNHLNGQPSGEALRLAKLKMLETAWNHPYYWAALTIQGNPKVGSEVHKSN